jgi:uncharacterized membrane protein
MKYAALILFLGISLGSFSQIKPLVEVMDKSEVRALEPDEFEYVNLSVESELIIEEKSDIFIDFSTLDMPLTAVDSMHIALDREIVHLEGFTPFMLRNVDESVKITVTAFVGGDTLDFKASGSKQLTMGVKRFDRPVFVNDKIVFGLLAIILALIFYTSSKKTGPWKKFYMIIPALLLCYLIPAVLDLFGLISKDYSELYPMARDYLLPAALILMTLGIDFKGILNLGPKALIMFFTATVGIILGGPIAVLVFSWISPDVVDGEGADAAWRGLSTIAGSWIGGGANQNAMYATYKYAPELYGKMIVVDIVVANMWMAFLLWAAARADKFDRWLKADTSSIEDLKKRVADYQDNTARKTSLVDYMVIIGLSFGIVGLAHFGGKWIGGQFADLWGSESPAASSFLWLVIIATIGGLILSATKLRSYEGAGASKVGSVFIYILVATIGMKMDLKKVVEEPELILLGIIWMLIHVIILFTVAKIIKAPFFFLAVGSKANVGGAASAPIVAAAFHPSLASVGAILAVLGYAIGTIGAILCAEMMSFVAPV